tara:strand:+ start:473 stop:673 length:201 start_codon:yes stop_codon:yes gene_type:complete
LGTGDFKMAKNPPLGSGKRFKNLTKTLTKGGTKNPKALAAWIGRKKYGTTKMANMSAAGRKGSKKA